MKAKQERKVRGYKAADADYKKALKRGDKQDEPLATLIESVVRHYAKGAAIVAQYPGDGWMTEDIILTKE